MDRPTRDLTPWLEDAAHYPGGHAAGIVFPRTTAEVADAVRTAARVLPIGAQSSLTGGATPMGETILATAKMTRILASNPGTIRVEAGVTVAALQEHLAARGAWFPPAPTYTGACAGGIAATNAAGAATFRYGSTRDWVAGLTVVLADGTALDLVRGERHAPDGVLHVPTARGTIAVRVPTYRMPDVAKRSAGYHAAPGMDLVDLFIGSEGTLGVITEVLVRTLEPAPAVTFALIPCTSEPQALRIVAALCTWPEVAAVEHMDARSIAIVREDGADVKHHVTIPADTAVALLAQIEVPADTTPEAAYEEIAAALTDPLRDGPLSRLPRLLHDEGLLEVTELALAGDRRRVEALTAVREAVPAGVNRRVGEAKRTIDPRIEKTAADMIVPLPRFGEMMDVYRRGFTGRGLDYAIWGHVSDGNVHPNVIPRSYDDVVQGKAAILEFGREVARLGGSPLAEHGVGRNAVKQALLRQLYGESGIEQMRAVKRALDPEWKLAPGVVFARR